MSFQQELIGQTVPSNTTLRQFQTQRLLTDHKDIGPWNTTTKRSTPRDLHHKIEHLINSRKQNRTERTSQNPEQQSVILKRFKTHVFEFVDRSKISQVYSLQKQRKPYAFRCFELSSCLPQQKQVSLKNPVEPVYVSLLKYKKTKLKNKMNQIVNRLMKNQPKSMTIPSLSQRYLQDRSTKIASLGYQKINFKITSKHNKYLK